MQTTLELLLPRMTIDVDGAPNAYGPDDSKALDNEINAHEGNPPKESNPIVGYLTVNDDGRTPLIQGPQDPKPGFYISTSSFQDPSRRPEDPRKYCNAAEINYVVLGRAAKAKGVKPGDFVVVHSKRFGSTVFGVVGDTGNNAGSEGSLALARSLGYNFHDGKSDSIEGPDVVVRYYANSNQVFYDSQSSLNDIATNKGLDTNF